MTNVHFSSKTDDWATPQDFFDKLNSIYNFDMDVCASHENAKCPVYFTEEDDGLSKEWFGNIWMNPPYGREIGKWVKKAYESSVENRDTTVVCLLPARTDVRWMHDYVFKYARFSYFLKGRLKFGEGKANAPFPSMISVFSQKIPYNTELEDLRNCFEGRFVF